MRKVSFDPVARPYRWLEYLSFGPLLERCRFALLPALRGAGSALVLGDGDGRFLAQLLLVYPQLRAHSVDSSAAMLRLARARVLRLVPEASARVRFQHADALAFAGAGEYDLLVTQFFLDCLTPQEIERLLERVMPQLAADAQWLISEFAIPPREPFRTFARVLVRMLYAAFGLLTGLRTRQLPPYAAPLRQHGFALHRETSFLRGTLRSELWQRQG